MRFTGTGEPISSISKAKMPGFSSVVQKSGAMYLSMFGVGRIIVAVGSGLGKDTTFLPILRSRSLVERRKSGQPSAGYMLTRSPKRSCQGGGGRSGIFGK